MSVISEETPKIPRDTLEQLEVVLQSPAFAQSPRCQDFLRFVVRELVEGRADSIKESTIALEVFGKGVRFDPGSDSLVRVRAREVRKRLAEYYESTSDAPLMIELPVGSYVPVLRATGTLPGSVLPNLKMPVSPPEMGRMEGAPEEVSLAAPKFGRRRALWLLGGSLGACAAITATLSSRSPHSSLDLLWRPIFAKGEPLLIFIPLLPQKGEGAEITDRVGMGTTAVVGQAAQYLTKTHHPYRLRFGADLTFSQLREQPSLLLGGFSSQWTLRMTHGLRFNLLGYDPNQKDAYVVDTQTGQKWGPVNAVNGFADHDYSLLCRLFDANSGQVMLIAAGITTFGTESAASFLFDDGLFSALLEKAPKDWQVKNFQAVIQTSIIGTTPSTPRVVTTYFW
jgi:hypothetical protein